MIDNLAKYYSVLQLALWKKIIKIQQSVHMQLTQFTLAYHVVQKHIISTLKFNLVLKQLM